MSTITFDRLAYLDSLKAAGIPEPQARAHAVALDTALHETVATQADIAAVRHDITAVRADMQLLERNLKIWFGKMMAWQLTAIAALLAIATAAIKRL
jgi:hypothetical protein